MSGAGRMTKTSVTNFLYHGSDYLFLRRNDSSSINAGEINGIGGKLDPGEDYLSAAIRETKEETGYQVSSSKIKFCGIIKFEGGYAEDWVTCFFKIKVPRKEIPIGNTIKEGQLFWLPENKVLSSGLNLVDDINYIFKYIRNEHKLFYMNVKVDKLGKKIIQHTLQTSQR